MAQQRHQRSRPKVDHNEATKNGEAGKLTSVGRRGVDGGFEVLSRQLRIARSADITSGYKVIHTR